MILMIVLHYYTILFSLKLLLGLLSSSTIQITTESGTNSMRWLIAVPTICSLSGSSSSSSSVVSIVKQCRDTVLLDIDLVVC